MKVCPCTSGKALDIFPKISCGRLAFASERVLRRGRSFMRKCASLRRSIIVAEVISRKESKRMMTA